ncbi:LytR family transcriptional regulator [Priestia flexa]|uniref:Polyisoprenyl-teichoic acid--peptidoglycan teichoic acid transferase TagU n=1 Tax=Priestia veravalensis TaxID=1414648 RepID=A0A0V8JIY7_9BACI|nr:MULTISPECIES: LytR family transcriptional regulator [Priestia]KSU87019.1 trascriptional regulator [Priestia veravalensis]MCM3067771.1 LytR family transcriptional regulator [Priestia flexa]MEC0667007.1 LytR family transcriptional regulator [Priestia flexa]WHX80048.1 LytR family transcriptional regulator [Priestia flexa]SCC43922.1 transcriptional attenuator, LytR family [Priestia flexa]
MEQERRRKKRKSKKKKGFIIALSIVLVLILGIGVYAFTVYNSVASTLNRTHEPLSRTKSEKRTEQVNFSERDPISILLLGVDQRGADKGRSDSLILLTVNPDNQSVKMVSIPRDTRTEIVGKGKEDKINHAYAFGGVDMSIKTVENFLDVPIDYYVQVNMEGFQDIVDAVGGVTVNNTLDFTYEGQHFAKGQLQLNGEDALKYSRMRYEDPRGDFGRQERQRQIIQAVIDEGASVKSLTNYGSILDAIGDNVKTNLTFDEMKDIQTNYKDARHNLEQIQLDGSGSKASDGIYYYHVSETERTEVSNLLKEQLNIK